MLYEVSAGSDDTIGGLVGYNFLSGEPIVGIQSGIPLIARMPSGKLTLANFMQMQLYSALGAMSVGMEVLAKENVQIDDICGHGGFFKTPFIGANAMSAALGAPVTVMKNAGEGGAWGIALLALYGINNNVSLGQFLDKLFESAEKETTVASEQEKAKFATFMKSYKAGLVVEDTASKVL
jgi:sugar (pentulose or hexulose) kinase